MNYLGFDSNYLRGATYRQSTNTMSLLSRIFKRDAHADESAAATINTENKNINNPQNITTMTTNNTTATIMTTAVFNQICAALVSNPTALAAFVQANVSNVQADATPAIAPVGFNTPQSISTEPAPAAPAKEVQHPINGTLAVMEYYSKVKTIFVANASEGDESTRLLADWAKATNEAIGKDSKKALVRFVAKPQGWKYSGWCVPTSVAKTTKELAAIISKLEGVAKVTLHDAVYTDKWVEPKEAAPANVAQDPQEAKKAKDEKPKAKTTKAKEAAPAAPAKPTLAAPAVAPYTLDLGYTGVCYDQTKDGVKVVEVADEIGLINELEGVYARKVEQGYRLYVYAGETEGVFHFINLGICKVLTKESIKGIDFISAVGKATTAEDYNKAVVAAFKKQGAKASAAMIAAYTATGDDKLIKALNKLAA